MRYLFCLRRLIVVKYGSWRCDLYRRATNWYSQHRFLHRLRLSARGSGGLWHSFVFLSFLSCFAPSQVTVEWDSMFAWPRGFFSEILNEFLQNLWLYNPHLEVSEETPIAKDCWCVLYSSWWWWWWWWWWSTPDLTTALFWIITQRVGVIYYRRFGTTYRSHLQGSRVRFWSLTPGRRDRFVLPERW